MRSLAAGAALAIAAPGAAFAQDAEGCADHPAVSRYPDAIIEWCATENFAQYKVPTGPVTGYRQIEETTEIEGRVTRVFYALVGERTHAEVYANYRDALAEGGFELIASGLDPSKRSDVGGRQWLGVYYRENPWEDVSGAPVSKLASGTSTEGGAGVLIGKKERADDTIYALVSLEQHSADEVAILVDVIETKAAETGLVTANAEAMGEDIEELGRTVLEGLFFDHDKASLTPASKPALDEIARYLKGTDKDFYVVGHTDSTGAYAYNAKLSADRAAAVRAALIADYGIALDRLQSHGVGPLVPVFANATDGGRAKNRRVELVER
ncbi:MAG: OmpA family protein [Pseudomonadota bacterium]